MSDASGNEGSEFRDKFESSLDENRSLRTELALTKAGVDTESPLGAMFSTVVGTRDGEIDIASLKTEWAELSGAAQPPPPSPGVQPPASVSNPTVPGVSQEALESLAMGDQLGGTAQPPPATDDETAQQAAWRAVQDSKEKGEAIPMQQAAFFGTLMSRAAQGDPTAVWTQDSWNEKLRDAGEIVR
jgi:hypothetical protein